MRFCTLLTKSLRPKITWARQICRKEFAPTWNSAEICTRLSFSIWEPGFHPPLCLSSLSLWPTSMSISLSIKTSLFVKDKNGLVMMPMTVMSVSGKFPTTNSKIHHRNPSWKSILPKHAKSQTYSAHSCPLRQFRKLCPRRFFVEFQNFGRLSTFYSHSTLIFLFFSSIQNNQNCGLSEYPLVPSYFLKL